MMKTKNVRFPLAAAANAAVDAAVDDDLPPLRLHAYALVFLGVLSGGLTLTSVFCYLLAGILLGCHCCGCNCNPAASNVRFLALGGGILAFFQGLVCLISASGVSAAVPTSVTDTAYATLMPTSAALFVAAFSSFLASAVFFSIGQSR